MSKNEIQSPCVSVCSLDDDDVCIGCYRTAAEITAWSQLNNADKKQVLLKVSERAETMHKHTLL